MLDRIADLTWHRPKLVLGIVCGVRAPRRRGGPRVEHHLKAAGFTDSASESERATSLQQHELGYDASPGIVPLVRDAHGGKLDLARPAVRREVDRVGRALAQTRYVGRVDNSLHDRGARRAR